MILIKGNVEREAEERRDIAELVLEGFKPLNEDEPVPDTTVSQPSDLAKMKVEDLRTLAKERGIESAALKKQDLIALLSEEGEEEAGDDDEPGDEE